MHNKKKTLSIYAYISIFTNRCVCTVYLYMHVDLCMYTYIYIYISIYRLLQNYVGVLKPGALASDMVVSHFESAATLGS